MDEILASTHLNLAVIGKDALRIRNNIADLRGGLDLSIRGSLARPVIFGSVEVDRGGVLLPPRFVERVEPSNVIGQVAKIM